MRGFYLDNVKLESVSYLRLSRSCVFFENDGLRAKMRRGLGFITNLWYKWVFKKKRKPKVKTPSRGTIFSGRYAHVSGKTMTSLTWSRGILQRCRSCVGYCYLTFDTRFTIGRGNDHMLDIVAQLILLFYWQKIGGKIW